MPLFIVSFVMTSYNLNYTTPVSGDYADNNTSHPMHVQGKGKSTKEMLKRIDYGGTLTLFMAVSAPTTQT